MPVDYKEAWSELKCFLSALHNMYDMKSYQDLIDDVKSKMTELESNIE